MKYKSCFTADRSYLGRFFLSPLVARDVVTPLQGVLQTLVSRRLVNTHFIIVFVLVHLLSISVSLVNNYYTISLLSPINVPCKYMYKDFISVIATKSPLLNRRCSIIATGYLLPLRARPKSLFLLHLRCLPFVCIIGIVLVFSFVCNRYIFS